MEQDSLTAAAITDSPSVVSRCPLAVYYEHPDWFRPLFAEFDRRDLPYIRLDAGTHRYDASEEKVPWAAVFNRMSPSAHTRERGHAVFYTLQFLTHLERLGVRVINGAAAYRLEISKAFQIDLLARLSVSHPRTRVIHRPADAIAAAEGFVYPLVVKPNVGGSGAGIRRFDDAGALARAVMEGSLDLGIDGTALVQELVPAEAGRIVRVEVLGGRFLYAIRLYPPSGRFDLCPADVCRRPDELEPGPARPADAPDNGVRVEGYLPPPELAAQAEGIVSAAGIEVGGVEYLVDARDGRALFYDINALSNFVVDAPRVVGFDPFARLVDWLESEVWG